MKTAEAFSPTHITGLFYIMEKPDNLLHKGSLGAGFSLNRGVYTRVNLIKAKEKVISIRINDVLRPDAVVSQKVMALFLDRTGISSFNNIIVEHTIQTPQGSGFGTSGAGALSLALALNSVFDNPLTETEAAQIAHIAEVESRTGLGTVLGETFGGFKMSVKPGAPGIGSIDSIPYPEDTVACFIVFGPYPTRKALGDENTRMMVNKVGENLHRKLKKDPTLPSFLKLSRRFAEETGLISSRVRGVLKEMDDRDIPGSMLMFGEGVFAVTNVKRRDTVLDFFNTYKKNNPEAGNAEVFCGEISLQGAHIVGRN